MKTFHRFCTLALFLAVSGLANVAFSQGAGGGGGTGGGGTGGGGTGGGGTTGGGTGGTTFGNTGSTFGNNSNSSNNSNSGTGTGAATAINGRKYTSVGAKPQTATGNRRYTSVGAKAAGAAGGARGATGAGGAGGLGGGAGLGTSSLGLNQPGTKTGSTDTNPTVRTRLSSGVAVAPSFQASSPAMVQQNASRSMAQTRFRGVGITVTDSATVIGGTVKNESDRRMAELLLRLEPGVSRIENRITVAP